MAAEVFQFRHFSVRQECCAMKVGTDGVLLAAWADLKDAQHILDIGTGTGLIALIAAQRLPAAQVHAIEIEVAAAKQAQDNITSSPYAERVKVMEAALQDFESPQLYDSIICNPPFFNSSSRTADEARNMARHGDSLNLGALMEHSARLARESGFLHIIWPVDRALELDDAAQAHGWYRSRRTTVYPNPSRPAKRQLHEFSRYSGQCIEGVLTIEGEERHAYTKGYIALCGDYYPGMP